MNIFGRDYEEIGSKDKGLILNGNGKIKIRWHNKFIDLIDNNGNIKVQKLIQSVDSEDDIKSDGIYVVDGKVIVSFGGEKYSFSGGDSSSGINRITESDIDTILNK